MKLVSQKRWRQQRLFWLLLAFAVTAYFAVKEPPAPAVSAGTKPLNANAIYSAVLPGNAASNDASFALKLPARAPFPATTSEEFAARSWYVAPPPPPTPKVAPVPVIQAPSAPPLPFSYLGKVGLADGRDFYLLVKGDSQISVAVGDTFDGQYKLEEVQRGRLIIRYLPLAALQDLSTEPR